MPAGNPSDLEDAAFILEQYRTAWDHEALSDGSPVMETLAQVGGWVGGGGLSTAAAASAPRQRARPPPCPTLPPAPPSPTPQKNNVQLQGPYAFIIFDRSEGRIVAARDPLGALVAAVVVCERACVQA